MHWFSDPVGHLFIQALSVEQSSADAAGKLPTIRIAAIATIVTLASICSLLERRTPNGLIKELIDSVTFKLTPGIVTSL